jgi:hypothetical protein
MQSPTAVFCRTLAMMALLVGVPLVAIFGSASVPRVARLFFESRWWSNSASARDSFTQAPRTSAMAAARPRAGGELRSSLPQFHLPRTIDPPSVPASPAEARFVSDVVALAALVSDASVTRHRSANDRLSGLSPITAPDVRHDPPDASPAELFLVATDRGPLASAPPRDPRFAAIEEKLHRLGATYYLLESWGSHRRLYRFQCEMAVDGNPRLNRHFEATDADPRAAMTKVMAEVEGWRREAQ